MGARVRVHVYPPYSYKMSGKKVGALVLEQEIGPGRTLGDLFAALEAGNPEAWRDLFDARTGRMQPAVLTILNGRLLPRSDVPRTVPSDGDQIDLRMTYSGG